MRVVALVPDLLFGSKITAVAAHTPVEARLVADVAQLLDELRRDPAATVILDLNAPDDRSFTALAQLRADPQLQHLKVIGFLSHVQVDLAQRARAAGCDQVMARSEFSRDLPRILQAAARVVDPRAR